MRACAVTVRTALARAAARLAPLANAAAMLEAEVLLAHVLDRSRTWLYTWPDCPLGRFEQQHFDQLVARRATGKPIAHLLGKREFWSLMLTVNEQTLIPRPATETLVEWGLSQIAKRARPRILDLGTGCGAIALAFAAERPDAWVLATDRHAAPLDTARANARSYGITQVQFIQADWLESLDQRTRFDLIVSNPPYLAVNDPHLEQGDVRFEPRAALCAGRDGLADLRSILGSAPSLLSNNGWLLVEHGAEQGLEVRALFQSAHLSEIATRLDLAGRERVTGAVRATRRDLDLNHTKAHDATL